MCSTATVFTNSRDRQLTRSLLKADFNLSMHLPDDRLCPPVPVRWNYIHWIQEILDSTSDTFTDRCNLKREVTGLDIGVGASCIYPLLACSTRPLWRMFGTDIDAHSLAYAKANVANNSLDDRVRLRLTSVEDPLVPLEKMGVECLDFVMTNPPFYSSEEDMKASYGSKLAPPSAICTGAENEMICHGGDVGFATRILDESLVLRAKVQWYTVMLGKLSSLQQIVVKLKEAGIKNFAVTALRAGYRTRRWAVGWSFGDFRPRNDVARHGELVQAVLPPVTAQTIKADGKGAVELGRLVDEAVKTLDVRWKWRENLQEGVMMAKENVWSRAARRKKKFQRQAEDEGKMEESDEDEERMALAVKIACKKEYVVLRWLRGEDHVVFESFSGFLKRAVTDKR